MNWYILAGVLLAACAACVLCYYAGMKNGATVELEEESEAAYERGYNTAKNEEAALLQNKVEVAFHNGRTKGFQLGVDHQKRIHADRARDAARRDGKGRFKKGGV
jgi:hypothetical protein